MARNRNELIGYRYEGERRVATIAGTGVHVWAIVGYRRLGMSDVEIQETLPHLTLEQVRAALAYYEKHPSEIDRTLERNNSLSPEEAERLQKRWAVMVRMMKGDAETIPG